MFAGHIWRNSWRLIYRRYRYWWSKNYRRELSRCVHTEDISVKKEQNFVARNNNFRKVFDSLTKRDTFAFPVAKLLLLLLGHPVNLANPPSLIRVTPWRHNRSYEPPPSLFPLLTCLFANCCWESSILVTVNWILSQVNCTLLEVCMRRALSRYCVYRLAVIKNDCFGSSFMSLWQWLVLRLDAIQFRCV